MKVIKKANQKKSRSAKIIPLNASYQGEPLNEKLINGIWNTAQSALWFNQNFSEKEKESFKVLITDHLFEGRNNKQTFKELIERICLAKRYVQRKRGRYISKPQDWLNIHYPLGLTGTKGWLERVKEIRKEVPDYNKGIKILSIGIVQFLETPDQKIFNKYRKELINERQFDLLQIFNNTIINFQYNN